MTRSGPVLLLAGGVLGGCSPEAPAIDVPLADHAQRACWEERTAPAFRAREYRLDATYGAGIGEGIGRLAGLHVSARDDVVIFDGWRQQVTVLDEELELTRVIGRAGEGPGEFASGRFILPSAGWVHSRADTLWVLDGYRISRFRLSTGEYLNGISVSRLGVNLLFDVRSVHAGPGRLDVVYWHTPLGSSGHWVAALRLDAESQDTRSLARMEGLPWPRPPGGGPRLVPGEALPMMDLRGECAAFVDGHSAVVSFVSLRDSSRVAVEIPELPIPEPDPVSAEVARNRAAVMRMGGVGGDVELEPRFRKRWNDMTFDRAGRVWIEPWRPKSMASEPLEVLVVTPSTGEYAWHTVPVFPRGFLTDGSLVAVVRDPDTDEEVVALFRTVR